LAWGFGFAQLPRYVLITKLEFFRCLAVLDGVNCFFSKTDDDLNMLECNIWMHLFHLIILAQWAVIIVPFGKWTHFLYRSFAMYFE